MPASTSGKSWEKGGFVGRTTPAVTGKSFDQLRPAKVTSSEFEGSIARAHRLSWLEPPIRLAYFRSALPRPSSFRRARAPSCEPFQVASKAPGVDTKTWTLLPVTQ